MKLARLLIAGSPKHLFNTTLYPGGQMDLLLIMPSELLHNQGCSGEGQSDRRTFSYQRIILALWNIPSPMGMLSFSLWICCCSLLRLLVGKFIARDAIDPSAADVLSDLRDTSTFSSTFLFMDMYCIATIDAAICSIHTAKPDHIKAVTLNIFYLANIQASIIQDSIYY
jgi:hypothetical protein